MEIKPFKEYQELIALLKSRNMHIDNENYAHKKLMQVGYYRLSGFWHICKTPDTNNQLTDTFLPNTNFNQVYLLYIFDKKCRIALLDAIERLEITLRAIIAHEMAKLDPLAYLDDFYIQPSKITHFAKYKEKLEEKIQNSRDDCILWHTQNNKAIPFWVIVEIWDFGMLSKYFSMLRQNHQKRIAQKFGVDNVNVMINWLNEINIVRNHCAHHSRVWNKKYNNPIKLLQNDYFDSFNFSEDSKKRVFVRMLVIWYLISYYTEHYDWNFRIVELIRNKLPTLPNAKLKSMGIESDEYLRQFLSAKSSPSENPK